MHEARFHVLVKSLTSDPKLQQAKALGTGKGAEAMYDVSWSIRPWKSKFTTDLVMYVVIKYVMQVKSN